MSQLNIKSTNKEIEEQANQSLEIGHGTILAPETIMHKPALPYP